MYFYTNIYCAIKCFFLIQGKILQKANDFIKGNNFWLAMILATFPNTWLSSYEIDPLEDVVFQRDQISNLFFYVISGDVANQKMLLLTYTNAF